jgi:hypothetical protein
VSHLRRTEAAQMPALPAGWTKIEPGGDTACAHNTPFAFWVRPGTVNDWVVYFEGGGGCWDYETCNYGSSMYNSDVGFEDDPARHQAGIFDFDNPANPLKDHYWVYVPSCGGDVYLGDNVQTYTSEEGFALEIQHKGFVNGSSALKWVSENVRQPEPVFVTGCSAGSVGSIVFAPHLIEQYPASRVTQVGDSLAFVYHRSLNMQTDYHAHDNFPNWIPALLAILPGEFTSARYYAGVASHYPDHTFAQYNSALDDVQVQFYTAVGGVPGDFGGALLANLHEIHANAANFRSYTAEGTLHCAFPREAFYSYNTDGTPLVDWVTGLVEGRGAECGVRGVGSRVAREFVG